MLKFPEAREKVEQTISDIHSWALKRFTYERDETRWAGDPHLVYYDHWETDAELIEDLVTRGEVVGDCDAFAKLCWFLCRRLGIESRLVYCIVETGEGHLVCDVNGRELDNRQGAVVARNELEKHGYRFVSASKPWPGKPGEKWVAIVG